MATYASKSPGIYLEDTLRAPASRFETAVPAFLGSVADTAEILPLDAPSWSELEQRRGVAWAPGAMGLAVRGFFQNGGRRCYAIPLADPSDLAAALGALAELSEIDLVCAPGLGALGSAALAAAQARILALCADRGDCFAILDSVASPSPDPDVVVAAATGHRQALDAAIGALALSRGIDSEALRINGALYFPWLKVLGGGGDRVELIPPSGHVAGIYADTDDASGVHKAPANVALEGVLDLQVPLSGAQLEALNPDGVTSLNGLRAFTGRGIRIWGARTLSRAPAWRHVSVRRLMLTIGRWLESAMPGVAFEPNDLGLWIRVGREVTAFLDDLYRQGVLRGSTPNEAFYVKCDAETNTQAVRDAGQVVTEIGVAPESPKEFLVVRLIHGDGGVSVATAAGAA